MESSVCGKEVKNIVWHRGEFGWYWVGDLCRDGQRIGITGNYYDIEEHLLNPPTPDLAILGGAVMGNRFRVYAWKLKPDGSSLSYSDYKYIEVYIGESFVAACVAAWKAKRAGSGCIKFEWRP